MPLVGLVFVFNPISNSGELLKQWWGSQRYPLLRFDCSSGNVMFTSPDDFLRDVSGPYSSEVELLSSPNGVLTTFPFRVTHSLEF